MSLLSINLEQKLIASNRRALAERTAVLSLQSNLDAQIERLRLGAEKAFAEGKSTETLDAAKVLGFDYVLTQASAIKAQNAAISHLPQDRIFTTIAIKDICLTYGLRFLPTSLYKGALDDKIPAKLEDFKRLNGGKMPGEQYAIRVASWTGHLYSTFYIAAPAASFALSPRPKDPLLFAYLGSDRWYLIHKWGDDLTVGARIANWPWRAVWGVVICASICFALGGGAWILSKHEPPSLIMAIFGLFSIPAYMAWCEDHTSGRVTSANWNSPFSN